MLAGLEYFNISDDHIFAIVNECSIVRLGELVNHPIRDVPLGVGWAIFWGMNFFLKFRL